MSNAPHYQYELLIYRSNEDGMFWVEVPELPGCMADGKTYQEIVSNAEVIIDEWIEAAAADGEAIPEPKSRIKAV